MIVNILVAAAFIGVLGAKIRFYQKNYSRR